MEFEINKVYCEDCRDTMSRMSDGFVDLTVTSPPYDKLRKYEGYDFDFEGIAAGLWRVTKVGGVLVWVVGDQTKNGSESGTSFRQALYFMSLGFRLHDTMIYQKVNFIPQSHNRYEQEFEYMFVFSKAKPNTFNPLKEPCKTAGVEMNTSRKGYGFKEGAYRRREGKVVTGDFKTKGNIWGYTCGNSGVSHEAPFPEKLAADHIVTWSNSGQLVYDPFMGSGTVAKKCIELDRRYVGSEISQKYCDDIDKRLYPLKSQTTIKFG